jgi:carbonic anhydrase
VSINPNLERLLEGNRRFVSGQPQYPHQNAAHRQTLLGGQRPFAAVVGCTDSRVPPELIFDQGFGDLYIARVGGSVVGELAIASLELGVMAFGIELIVVLGHSGCGAINATIQGEATVGFLPDLAAVIQPSVEAARGLPGDMLVNTVQINARRMARLMLEQSAILAEAEAQGKIAVAAAYYDLSTGVVEVLETL